MSRSQPRTTNPSTFFLQWKNAELSYYDKEAKADVVLAFPFTFLVLDELSTIKGFLKADNAGYWSNEVRNVSKDPLTVKTKSGTKGTGIWKDLEGLKANGAKYAKSIYIAMKDSTGEFVIANLSLSGAALTAWIEFQKRFDVDKIAVVVKGKSEAMKNGATTYWAPVFDGVQVSAESDAAAMKLDKELQTYLSGYFSNHDSVEAELSADDFEDEDQPDDEVEAPVVKATNVEEVQVELTEVPF